jgi:toxin YoeB
MSWTVRISRQARADLDHFRAHDTSAYVNCHRLSKAVSKDPFGGVGKPRKIESLGGEVWCRRITLEDRMVYEVFEHSVTVAAYRTHIE